MRNYMHRRPYVSPSHCFKHDQALFLCDHVKTGREALRSLNKKSIEYYRLIEEDKELIKKRAYQNNRNRRKRLAREEAK